MSYSLVGQKISADMNFPEGALAYLSFNCVLESYIFITDDLRHPKDLLRVRENPLAQGNVGFLRFWEAVLPSLYRRGR